MNDGFGVDISQLPDHVHHSMMDWFPFSLIVGIACGIIIGRMSTMTTAAGPSARLWRERRLDHHQWPYNLWKFLSENTRMATAHDWLEMFHDFRPDPGRSHLAVMMQTIGDLPQRGQLRMLSGKLNANIEYQGHYGGIRITTETGLTWCIYPALTGEET